MSLLIQHAQAALLDCILAAKVYYKESLIWLVIPLSQAFNCALC